MLYSEVEGRRRSRSKTNWVVVEVEYAQAVPEKGSVV